MNYKIPVSIILISAVLGIGNPAAAQKKWPGVVLYSLDFNGLSHNLIIDPVVRISNGEYSYPVPIPPDSWDKEDSHTILAGYFNRFNKEEYSHGRKMRVYIDGYNCGSASVTILDTVNSCSPVVSEVNVSYIDSVRHHFTGYGLVIPSLPPRKTPQIFPVDSILERSLYDYGKDQFIRKGIKKEIAEKMEIKDIRAADIDGDGKPEYLVSYFIIGEDARRGEVESNMQYSHAAILKKTAEGFTEAFSHYPDFGIPEETHVYKFIDVIDLDGDGVCEVVIQNIMSMTSWDYILLKKKGNVWEQVYEGAGSGC